jgi:hypothetical protein
LSTASLKWFEAGDFNEPIGSTKEYIMADQDNFEVEPLTDSDLSGVAGGFGGATNTCPTTSTCPSTSGCPANPQAPSIIE